LGTVPSPSTVAAPVGGHTQEIAMRVGQNPARFVEKVAQPAEIMVAVVNCIPFLSGYYEQSLDVLKVVVESLNATRESDHPYDVLFFDNHSCQEVRAYLKEASDLGKIQYLVLSESNIGKIGAWNYMFGAAQGLAFCIARFIRDIPKCWHGNCAAITNAQGIFHCHFRMGLTRENTRRRTLPKRGD
jgi:hypothetical protein